MQGNWDGAEPLLEQALASARSSPPAYGKRSYAQNRAAGVFESHGDTARAAALRDEARGESEKPHPR
jgi:hypothetical protein